MRVSGPFRSIFLASSALALLAGCTQGENIASPGVSNPGTPPGGGSGGGGGGGGSGVACPAGFATGTPVGGLTVCNISGTILTNLTLPRVNGVAYRLNGRVDVGVDIGANGSRPGGSRATLTIEPGVTVFGASGADYLVVNRGSQIVANGAANAPIVFTSSNDLVRRSDADASNDTGGDAIGEWGGLVLLGRAPINRCSGTATPGTEGCENIIEGVTNPEAVYGGALANDRSGVLRYVQVRFAGFAINQQGNELNGITFGGVGNETEVEFVQVHNNSDDGVEFFGGTVNVRYLVLTGNDDDSIDTDNGYQGNIQFVLVRQRAGGGDNIVEASSAGPNAGAPNVLSDATISNFTFVGARTNGWRLNTGTVGRYVNGVIDYSAPCFRWESSAGNGAAGYQGVGVDPSFNSILFDCNAGIATANSDTAAVNAAVAAGGNVTGPSSLAAEFFPGPEETGVTPFNATTLDPFFRPANYIGAFGPQETETNNWASGWTFALFPPATCPAGTTDAGTQVNGTRVCNVSGIIRNDVRLTRGNIYRISGRVDVGVDVGADGARPGADPASLTIESGVTLFGTSGADYVVVNRGSQIFSNGTANNPVIFTSLNDLLNSQSDPANAIGEWGGLVLLGRAPINRCSGAATPGAADCTNIIEGVTNPEAVYGGALPDDSSGALRYTQVRYAGFAINQQGNELNGITFGGVGRGTEVEYVQVHNNSDDGVEFFGGNVNVRYLVLTGNDDDSIDTDNGYQGAIQFAIVLQRAGGGDNIVEASSAGPNAGAPNVLSNATISNFTFIGNRTNGWRLNTGTVGRYVNGVIDYGTQCFRWESSAGNGAAGYQGVGVDPSFDSVLFDCALGIATANSDTAAVNAAVSGGANNTTNVTTTLTNTFVNGANETARTPFDVTTLNPFFVPVTYVGAVRDSSDRWWAGWSCGLEAGSSC